jgi:tetratricopeptide (TPR) repeat protein
VRSSCKIGSLFSFEISIVFISVLSIVLLPNTNTPFWAKIRLLTVEEYILEGNQNYHKGEFKKAIEAYEKAIDIKPDEEAYHNMGIALYYQLSCCRIQTPLFGRKYDYYF